VLYWIVQGKRDGEIATILSNSARTINHHVSSIIRKLEVESRTAAAIRALELLETTDPTRPNTQK
jgi:DNA-binding NarL/FixJ family response regulator